MINNFLWVFLGGGLGSIVRFALALYPTFHRFQLPIGTLAANIISCFILGISVAAYQKGYLTSPQKLLLTTGFCGGFSTFSTFSMENINLLVEGKFDIVFYYLILSISLGFLFFFLGTKII